MKTTTNHSFEEIPGTGGFEKRRFKIRWTSTGTGETHEATVGLFTATRFCERHGLEIGSYVPTPEEVEAAEEIRKRLDELKSDAGPRPVEANLTFEGVGTAEWDRTYPKPDRSNHKPQQDAKRESYPEIDVARGERVMNDGRPAVIEDWYDCDCEVFCRTAFYSTLGTDGWSEFHHYAYLEANGLLDGKTYSGWGVGRKKFMDPSGNEMWSSTVTMREG